MPTEAFSVRTDSKKVRQLDKLAKQHDRSRNYLVNQAIDQMLELQAWQNEQVKAGIEAADKGRVISDAEMNRIFTKYRD
ncbi:MAG: ribbon-helix-helix protein, CopG family [Gammaproteobacteria bacterium]|nr:ribbon-helix-helix protein, CopG family [Gammaproteobacteria bacterium]